MPDLCGGLMILAMVLGAVAVVGHLMWLMLAAIFKALSGEQTDRRTLRCPACNQELRLLRGRCAACGLLVKLPSSVPKTDSASNFEDQLNRLLNRGVIDTALFEKLTQALRKDQESPWIQDDGPETLREALHRHETGPRSTTTGTKPSAAPPAESAAVSESVAVPVALPEFPVPRVSDDVSLGASNRNAGPSRSAASAP